MATEPLLVRDNPERHRFEIDLGDGSFAIAEYTLAADKIMFTHTGVPEAHEGKGIGTTLIRFALDADTAKPFSECCPRTSCASV